MRVELRHFGIVVENLAASVSFWETLGFQVVRDDVEDEDWIASLLGFRQKQALRTVKLASPENPAVLVELLEFSRPIERDYALPNSTGITHVALTVSSISEVLQALDGFGPSLVSDAIRENPQGSARVCYVRAIDGVLLELVEMVI
jgi:catechol 2,3-dioxygenase-like lactoylglutathione lyase family enzyme